MKTNYLDFINLAQETLDRKGYTNYENALIIPLNWWKIFFKKT